MPARLKLLVVCVFALSLTITSTSVPRQGARPGLIPPSYSSGGSPAVGAAPAVTIIAWADRTRYAPGDVLHLNAILRNETESTVYVDRSMTGFWEGGNLGLDIRDEQGNHIPLPFLTHVPPPPPKQEASSLLPLESGYQYGTWLEFVVKDLFAKPGKYSIRITYHNWLPKEFIPQELRAQHVLAADAPAIDSEPVWIEVTQ